jgi:ribosomal protein S3
LDNQATLMHGYKFHFVGRFTRKQQSANLWFTKGVLPYSSAKIKLDYSFYSVVLRYSVCTIKVWLYKSKITPVYRYRII